MLLKAGNGTMIKRVRVCVCVRRKAGKKKKTKKGLNDGNHCKEGANWNWQQDQIKSPQERRNKRVKEKERAMYCL